MEHPRSTAPCDTTKPHANTCSVSSSPKVLHRLKTTKLLVLQRPSDAAASRNATSMSGLQRRSERKRSARNAIASLLRGKRLLQRWRPRHRHLCQRNRRRVRRRRHHRHRHHHNHDPCHDDHSPNQRQKSNESPLLANQCRGAIGPKFRCRDYLSRSPISCQPSRRGPPPREQPRLQGPQGRRSLCRFCRLPRAVDPMYATPGLPLCPDQLTHILPCA